MRNRGQTVRVEDEPPDDLDESLTLAELLEGRAHEEQIRVTQTAFRAWIKQVWMTFVIGLATPLTVSL